MTALQIRAEIQRLLYKENNLTVLEAIHLLLRREEYVADDELSDEEIAELNAQRADRISGKVKFISEEEAIRLFRGANFKLA